ncbi:MAG: Flp pilus assembly complex ATPase component TadA [Clostridia bacterium]|nr:Flp pilus assembly complex ATPase component TadA [Clostridia bacterium]
MKTINIAFKSEQDKIDFVNACEIDFEKRLDEATKKITSSKIINILLSGPTCSGKTTTANKIIGDYHEVGKEVTVISIDDFFLERDDGRTIKENEKIDYDSVDVIDLDLLKECISKAKPGNNIKVPIFDFITQSRVGYNAHYITEDEVLLYEGIQAVYPEVTSLFDDEFIGVFINVNEDVCLNGTLFSRDEIRLVRRLVRDRKFRGANADFTFYLWETVRENEDKNIFPNKNICTIQLDSFMGYELFLLKPYILEVLSEVNENSTYYDKAKNLIEKFSGLDEIKYEYIPKNSLYTEFLGKK